MHSPLVTIFFRRGFSQPSLHQMVSGPRGGGVVASGVENMARGASMIGTSIPPPSAGVGGRRLPQPPPEAQTALAMTSVTPLPMGQKPVPLSFRNRKLPKVPTSQPTNVGKGKPTLIQTNKNTRDT